MQIDTSTPRNDISIQGRTFAVPAPYSEGHTVTEGEAHALNQVFAENVRNNFAAQLKRWESARDAAAAESKEFSEPEPSQSDLDAYVADYEFGVRRAGTRVVVDPVEREARKLALVDVKAALVKRGNKIGDFSSDQLKAYVDQAVEKYSRYREKAQAIVDAQKSAAADLGADLLDGLAA